MFDPSADFADVTDGTETVILLRRGSDSGTAGTPVTHALRSAAITSEALVFNRSNVRKQVPADGQYMAGDVVWHLPVEELIVPPRLGDAILDGAGERWTILEVKRATLATRWRCPSRNLVVAHHLDDAITVLKAAYVKDSCGAAEAVWRAWRTGIRAKIQPAEVQVRTADQSRQAVLQYDIFIAEDLALDQTHRILGPDGTVYRVTSSLGAARIGELQVITAEVTQ